MAHAEYRSVLSPSARIVCIHPGAISGVMLIALHCMLSMTLDAYSDRFDDNLDQVSDALDSHSSQRFRKKCGQVTISTVKL